jgi:hypothetical protein
VISERRFLPIVAAVGALVLVQQAADLNIVLAGTDLIMPAGRMRLLTTIGTRGAALVTADILLVWATVALVYRPGLQVLGALHLALGGVALIAAPLFLLDAGRLVVTIGGREIVTYRVLVVRTVLLLVSWGIAGLLAGRLLSGLSKTSATDPA